MLSKNIKYPYVKLTFDIIGMVSSMGILLLLILNFHAKFYENGGSEFWIKLTGNSFILAVVLFFVTIMCTIGSTIFKTIKTNNVN